jgi:hypothetical protein
MTRKILYHRPRHNAHLLGALRGNDDGGQLRLAGL